MIFGISMWVRIGQWKGHSISCMTCIFLLATDFGLDMTIHKYHICKHNEYHSAHLPCLKRSSSQRRTTSMSSSETTNHYNTLHISQEAQVLTNEFYGLGEPSEEVWAGAVSNRNSLVAEGLGHSIILLRGHIEKCSHPERLEQERLGGVMYGTKVEPRQHLNSFILGAREEFECYYVSPFSPHQSLIHYI